MGGAEVVTIVANSSVDLKAAETGLKAEKATRSVPPLDFEILRGPPDPNVERNR
jgi:hypothetical protein